MFPNMVAYATHVYIHHFFIIFAQIQYFRHTLSKLGGMRFTRRIRAWEIMQSWNGWVVFCKFGNNRSLVVICMCAFVIEHHDTRGLGRFIYMMTMPAFILQSSISRDFVHHIIQVIHIVATNTKIHWIRGLYTIIFDNCIFILKTVCSFFLSNIFFLFFLFISKWPVSVNWPVLS